MISRYKATAKIVLAHKSRKSKIDGKQPVQLRIIYNRRPKYYTLPYSVYEEDFNKIFNGQVRGDLHDIRIRLLDIEGKANDILKSLDPFSLTQFETRLFRPRADHNNVNKYLQEQIDQARDTERISSKGMSECSMNSFKAFNKSQSFTFDDITVEWLKAYERYMSRSNSTTTIGMYLRCLRVVFNKAIRDGIVTRDQYPFGKGKYEIPTSRNFKKALDKDEIKRIIEYQPEPGGREEWARDMWLFSYLCNGINTKDIANLKFKDIDTETITFIRSKTSSTRKQQRPVVVPLTKPVKEIIKKWGNDPSRPYNYVFNILKPGLSPEQMHGRIHDFYSDINAGMKTIAEKAGIKKPVTTYTARHSFATVMKRNGASLEFISESLGHSDIRTTESYLAAFDFSTKKEWAEKLYDL
ncbi:MAG TPA: site-specific integrase [Bacteroidales bacterium]|nr:site-specific integrase [Bacteroidales bacterium]